MSKGPNLIGKSASVKLAYWTKRFDNASPAQKARLEAKAMWGQNQPRGRNGSCRPYQALFDVIQAQQNTGMPYGFSTSFNNAAASSGSSSSMAFSTSGTSSSYGSASNIPLDNMFSCSC